MLDTRFEFLNGTCSFCGALKRRKKKENRQVVVLMSAPSILTDLSVVDGIEENHRSSNDLEVWRNSNALRLNVLVLPSPEESAHGAHEGSRRLVAAAQPFSNLANLHLAEWSVS